MKKSLIIGTLSLAIAGCGGGGGSSAVGNAQTPASPAAPPAVERLASYIGSWSGECVGHELESATIVRAPGTTDSVNIVPKSDYFSGVNCTGTVIGTMTDSAVFTAKYVATVNSAVVFAPGSAAVPATVDQITASRTQSTQSVTGPGVVHTVKNGQAQWCMDFGGVNSTCILDMGTQPAQSGASGAFVAQGNNLFVLSPNGSIYTVDQKLTKK